MSDSPSRKRATKQKGWRIDAELAAHFTKFCKLRGWNENRQVEIALRDWMERKVIEENRTTQTGGYSEGDVIRPRPSVLHDKASRSGKGPRESGS